MSLTYSFSKNLRILSGQQYRAVFKRASSVRGKGFKLFLCQNSLPYPRLGLAVSKKKVKKAVQRNQIKRIIRNNFRLKQHHLQGVDIIFMADFGSDKLKKQQLSDAITKAFERVHSC